MHWYRKIWHISGVFLIFICYTLFSEFWAKVTMFLFSTIAVGADFFRHKNPAWNHFLLKTFKPIMREHEISQYAGTSYLLVGVFLVMFFFSKVVVGLTLLFLAFADPIASIIGIRYGKDKIFFHKSLQGFAAAFVVCSILSYLYIGYFDYPIKRLIVLSILCGLVGATAELIPIKNWDDNFTLPIISAVGLSVLFYVFDVFTWVG